MKSVQKTVLVLAWLVALPAAAQIAKKPAVPAIPGYQTLLCDFHLHTVFSDGQVWPTVRVDEAWRQGLDAIAITDHIEYRPNKKEFASSDLNRSFEIAAQKAVDMPVLVIHGTEITRDMPPGHLNAIFLSDVNPIETETWKEAIDAAAEQDAFIFWNHPGWKRQQPDGIPHWYDEHEQIYSEGKLHGIEIVNYKSYYPKAHQMAIDKKLTLLGNTDAHDTIGMTYEADLGESRPYTLVFAKEKSAAAIREALFARRTAVYWQETLYGDSLYVAPLFYESIQVPDTPLVLHGKARAWVAITNRSDLVYRLELEAPVGGYEIAEEVVLASGATVPLQIRSLNSTETNETLAIRFRVTNILPRPDQPLRVTLQVPVQRLASQDAK
ncbi:histidinol-phosphatase [candidate division KSB1 bacterium]|nr:histidinol-phosphatase [candidate division KSB1 bacterium]